MLWDHPPPIFEGNYLHIVFSHYFLLNDNFFLIHISVLTLSTTHLLNMSKLSTCEVFDNPMHFSLIKNLTIEGSQMCKLLDTSFGLDPLMPGSIILDALLMI